jgi:hypothetical protein
MNKIGLNSTELETTVLSGLQSELAFIENIHSEFKSIEDAGTFPDKESTKAILLKILKKESSTSEPQGMLADFFQSFRIPINLQNTIHKICRAVDILPSELSAEEKISVSKQKSNLTPITVTLSDLREMVLAYTKRKYIALNVFKDTKFPGNENGSAKVFSPLVDYVFKENDSLFIGVTLGIVILGGGGRSFFEMKARIRSRELSDKDNEKKSSVSPIYQLVSTFDVEKDDVVDDARRHEFSVMEPPGGNGSFELELIVLSRDGEIVEKVHFPLPSELRPVNVGLVNELIRNQSPAQSQPSTRQKINVTLPSQISDISLSSRGKELVVGYQLNLVAEQGQGFYAMIDLLDSEGQLVNVRSGMFSRYYFDDQKFQQLSKGFLSFRRFIPLSSGQVLQLKEELVLPRSVFGFGLRGREMIVSIFLFDSRHSKIDEVEQGFLISVKPGFLRSFESFLGRGLARIIKFFKDLFLKAVSFTSRAAVKFSNHNGR